METVEKLRARLEEEGVPFLRDEPMSRHTTFAIGGPAALLAAPRDLREVRLVQSAAREEGVPLKDYIAREKVVYSKHHLVYADASLDAVAAMLGFAS